jgi:hypothetical protein
MSTDPQVRQIPGYDFGSSNSAVSPLSEEELRQLEDTLGWTREDEEILFKHAHLFRSHAEEMVDSWRAVVHYNFRHYFRLAEYELGKTFRAE